MFENSCFLTFSLKGYLLGTFFFLAILFPNVANFVWALQAIERWHVTLALFIGSLVRLVTNFMLQLAYSYEKVFYYRIYLIIQGVIIVKTTVLIGLLFVNMDIALSDPYLTDKRDIRNNQVNIGVVGGVTLFFDIIDIIWWICVIILIVRPDMIPRVDFKKPNKIGAAVQKRMESLNCSALHKRN